MPNKRESIETLVRAVKFTGLEMNNKTTHFQNRGLSKRTIQALITDGIDAPERVLYGSPSAKNSWRIDERA
jgi:hypothetical protein